VRQGPVDRRRRSGDSRCHGGNLAGQCLWPL
jgi:hypothetical protein